MPDSLINGQSYNVSNPNFSFHYGNRGKLGNTPNFNPDKDSSGVWLEASGDAGHESGGLFCNGNTMALWSPGDGDILRVYDEDNFTSPKFVIGPGGNVGIGLGNPFAKLTVDDTSPDTTWNTAAFRKLALGPNWSHIHWGPAGNWFIRSAANTGNLVIQDTGGNVGIGTSNPSQKLEVNGNAKVTGGMFVDSVPVWDGTDDNDLTWNGSQICREGSSLVYKQNVITLEDDFSKILRLEPKQYQIKEEYGGQGNLIFGYIAEELDELGLSNLVNYDESGQPDGIKYKKICIYLLEVVKDLSKKVDVLYNSHQSE